MAPWSIGVLVFTILCIFPDFSYAARNLEIFRYDECMQAGSLGVPDRGKIPNNRLWASSISSRSREPWEARLDNRGGAWTASVQNSLQFLGIDLGTSYLVTAILTQGRQGSSEFVTEYTLDFSIDNGTWSSYTNEYGTVEIFTANDNGDDIVKRTLKYPIVARYLKIRPRRWSQFISLRLDVEGCYYAPQCSKFQNGYISFDLSENAVTTETDKIILRFRTKESDGVLMYADGNQGDFISLELRRGYLFLRIDLGSIPSAPGFTQVIGKSMLDDSQWHDVVITRYNRTTLKFVVDRLENIVQTNGLFYRLNLDKKIYIGGVDAFNKGNALSTRAYFRGVMDMVNFNGIQIIRDASQGAYRFARAGSTSFDCSFEADTPPCTFNSYQSYIELKGFQAGGAVKAHFEFRTHDEDGLLLYHKMNDPSEVIVRLDTEGQVWYRVVSKSNQVVEDVVRNIDVDSPTQAFTDGLWHVFDLEIDNTKVNVTVDRNSKVSKRNLDIEANPDFFIGGSETESGFRGCLRDIIISTSNVNLESLPNSQKHSVEIGSCKIMDRCTPDPCEHGGKCSQSWDKFFCNCEGTGYKGEVCHTPAYQLSCEMHNMYTQMNGEERVTIDVDGSGPLKPFSVICNGKIDSSEPVETIIYHDSMSYITVDGYQYPDYYVRKIDYNTDLETLTEIVERSSECEQHIEYLCNNSLLLKKPDESKPETYGYWVGRTFQNMQYWGDAAPGSGKCKCGLSDDGCKGSSTTCECDSGLLSMHDSGKLLHKDYLPVMELHFSDTGSRTDNKIGQHKLGELKCRGDNILENVITFRKTDATLSFGTFEGDRAGDIWFQFKTTASDGIMIHNTNANTDHFIQIRMINGDTIQFRYNVGNGPQVLEYQTITGLSNNIWHTVHVERNRKQAWLRVDNYPEVSKDETQNEITRVLDLTSDLVVGASVDYRDGYVGCMRGLRVNGQLLDMRGKLRGPDRVTYGVSEGCVGKCASSPCFNGGTCKEEYRKYTCDCAYTPFRGWNCFREVGVNLQPSYMIKYTFDENQGLSATDFKYIRVGFTTKKKQGILIQLRNEANTEYVSLEMNNNGGVKFFLDVGFERWELNTPVNNIDYANGQAHEVIMSRDERKVTLQVDNYEAATDELGSQVSDTILDNPKYLYVGNNDTDTTNRGFEGCIYRMQIDNVYPLKRAFQDPRPTFVELTVGKENGTGRIREDMCGFEETTAIPDPIEIRPYRAYVNLTTPLPEVEDPAQKRIIIGVSVAAGFLVILILLLIFFIYFRQKGDYETKEAKGADMADNPDTAIVFCQTGVPDIPKRREWFM